MLGKGDELGGYRIEELLGVGGMAIVYRATQISLGRLVALKVLAPELGHDEAFRERFRREATHAAALNHPNLIPIHDAGEADGQLFIAMRLIEGETLADRMRRTGLSADDSLAILGPVGSALATVHSAGLVHRDVKPQNILIDTNGHPYLGDFGIARTTETVGLTASGSFVGSINYAAPEQIMGQPVTAATDEYALAAVLYQCLTGRAPYARDTDVGAMHAHLTADVPDLRESNGERFDGIAAVFERGLAKDPGSRFQSTVALMTATQTALAVLEGDERTRIPALSAPEPARADAPPASTTEAALPPTAAVPPPPPPPPPPTEVSPPSAGGPEVPDPAPPAQDETIAVAATTVDPRGRVAREAAAGQVGSETVAEEGGEPKPDAPARSGKGRRAALIGGAVALVAVLAGAVLLISGGGSDGSAQAADRTAISKVVRTWARTRAARDACQMYTRQLRQDLVSVTYGNPKSCRSVMAGGVRSTATNVAIPTLTDTTAKARATLTSSEGDETREYLTLTKVNDRWMIALFGDTPNLEASLRRRLQTAAVDRSKRPAYLARWNSFCKRYIKVHATRSRLARLRQGRAIPYDGQIARLFASQARYARSSAIPRAVRAESRQYARKLNRFARRWRASYLAEKNGTPAQGDARFRALNRLNGFDVASEIANQRYCRRQAVYFLY